MSKINDPTCPGFGDLKGKCSNLRKARYEQRREYCAGCLAKQTEERKQLRMMKPCVICHEPLGETAGGPHAHMRSHDVCSTQNCLAWYQRIKAAVKKAKTKSDGDSDLTVEWVVAKLDEQKYTCLGTKVALLPCNESDNNPFQMSFDQIVPSAGYFKHNVQIVSLAYNFLKNKFSEALAQTYVATVKAN